MILEELLEHTAKDHLDDRTDLIDGDPDELWGDQLLVRYFNEAQDILCRRSWVLIDTAHPQMGTIVLVSGKPTYSLHKGVLAVLEGFIDGNDTPLTRHSEKELRTARPYVTDGFQDLNAPNASSGAVIAFATDAGTRTMRVFRTPGDDEAGTRLLLKVARKPYKYLTLDEMQCSPEVPESWHMSLAKYAAGRCLRNHRASDEQKSQGRELLQEWERDLRDARQERLRLEGNPMRWALSSTTATL